MPAIRPLAADDLAPVTKLLGDNLPGWKEDESFLKETVLDHPWADPEIPSLVAVADDGEIVGFIGSQVRRVRFGDRSLRGVCCSHLVVGSHPGTGAAGAMLLSRLLRGPQAVTWSDSANEPVVRMWRAFGGHVDHSRACDWMLMLRPMRWAGACTSAVLRRRSVGRDLLPVGAFPAHAIARRPKGLTAATDVIGEDAGPAEVIACAAELPAARGMLIDHDIKHLEHVFALMRDHHGPLTCRLVRRGDAPIGWYIRAPVSRGVSRAFHVAAADADVDVVLGEMVTGARADGSAVLTGRLEPHLSESLQRHLPVIGLARRPVLHSRDSELLASLSTASSRLTQLDSEWFVL